MVAVGGPEGRLCLAVTFVCACVGSPICLHFVGGTIAWRRRPWGKLLGVFPIIFPSLLLFRIFFCQLYLFTYLSIYFFVSLFSLPLSLPALVWRVLVGAQHGGAHGWVAGWAGQSDVLVPCVWLWLQPLGPLSTWPPFATWLLTYWKFAF